VSAVAVALLNLALVIVLAPLFEGFMRKLKAVIHSRKGPPIIQPYLDILKLLGKEDLRPTSSLVFAVAPIVALAAVLAVAAMTPMGAGAGLPMGDMIVWIYLLSLSAVAVVLGAFASKNPYAYVGSSREVMMLLTAEPVVVIALLAAAVKSKSLVMSDMITFQLGHGPSISLLFAGFAFFLALQAQLAKLPFDIPEAETEIMEGPFIEQSGPRLALFKLAHYGKQLVFASVLVSVFIPWPRVPLFPANLLVALAKVFVLLLLVGVIDAVNPRLRIDQSMTYFSRVALLALVALAFAVVGV
jgi:formate hydrogenlyase subunit 4